MAISGRVPLLVLIGALPVIGWPQPLTVLGWLALVLVVCVADLLSAVRPELLHLARNLPPSVRLTESATSQLTVVNPTRRRAWLQLRDAWPPSAHPATEYPLLRVAPGGSVRQNTTVTPSRRGDLAAAAVTVRSYGPLRLVGRQRSLAIPGVLRVLPEFRSRSHLPSRLARLRELDGQASVHVRGQGTEFDSLREYAAGDDVRSIDWRATARATRTMVRTWRPERDRHVLMVLDTSRWAAGRIGTGTTDQLRLDAGIEVCLLMAALGSASGDRMSLLVADATVRQRLAGTAKGSALASFADRLSLAEATLVETDWSMVANQVDQLCRQRSLVVLITGLDPALYAEGLGTVIGRLAHQHQVVIAHVTDPAKPDLTPETTTAEEAYAAAASARLWLAGQGLSERVHRMGVEIVHADPDRVAPAVCDTYLLLKATGRL